MGLLLTETGALLTRDLEEAEVLNAFFTDKSCLRPPRSLSLLAESVGVRQYPQERGIEVESASPTGTHTSP